MGFIYRTLIIIIILMMIMMIIIIIIMDIVLLQIYVTIYNIIHMYFTTTH